MPIKKNPLPETASLHERFSYDPITGDLLLRSRRGQAWLDTATGPRVSIAPKTTVLASRVVWKMMTGEEPAEIIKHKNRDKFDLRWDNLFIPPPSRELLRQRNRKESQQIDKTS